MHFPWVLTLSPEKWWCGNVPMSQQTQPTLWRFTHGTTQS
jgi:hypothetical protein